MELQKSNDRIANSYLSLATLGKNQWWRYAISIGIIIIFSQLLGILPAIGYIRLSDGAGLTGEAWLQAEENMDYVALGLNKNIGLITVLISFVIGLIGLFLSVKFIHHKDFLHLINPFKKIRWNRIWFAMITWGSLLLLSLFGELLLFGENYTFQFDAAHFLPLILISLLFLPLQTSFEELIFRGYYLQMFALLTRYPIIPVAASSFIFALMHMWNPEVEAYGWPVMFSYYFAFGFCLALITLWDRGLEIALGMHAINNIVSALTVTYADAVVQVDALFISNSQVINWFTILMYIVFFTIFTYLYYRFFRK